MFQIHTNFNSLMFCLIEFNLLQVIQFPKYSLLTQNHKMYHSFAGTECYSGICVYLSSCLPLTGEPVRNNYFIVSHSQRCEPQVLQPFVCHKLCRHEMFNKSSMDTHLSNTPQQLFLFLCFVLLSFDLFMSRPCNLDNLQVLKDIARILYQFTRNTLIKYKVK